MDGLLIAARAVHYGATIVLFGEMVFALFINRRPTTGVGAPLGEPVADAPYRRFRRVAVAAWASMVVSGVCWLALVTGQMSGQPLGEIKPSAVATVLASTTFGHVWVFRTLTALLLALLWLVLRAGPPREPWLPVLSVGLAGGLLAGLAWAGHANAEVGVDGAIHHVSDAAHLLAAGTWLGGLAPFASLLETVGASRSTCPIDSCARIATRFGNWAALSVGVLVLTGITNAQYLVPRPQLLLETTYGRVLLVKLIVFSLMLAIALVNRTRLTSALIASGHGNETGCNAARQLRRNVWTEHALGAGVLVLVALLGVTRPPIGM